MILPLRYYGDPVLRVRCKEVEQITDEIRKLVDDMLETLEHHKGLGLAAPQVGVPIRLFILSDYIEDDEGNYSLSPPRVFINPKLSDPNPKKVFDNEGCLSIPGIRDEVKRPWTIHLEAIDLEGRPFSEDAIGYNARSRMHENDHLNGVLFTDRLELRSRKKVEPILKAIQKKYSS